MLKEILPVYKREMKAYFQSPATYVALGLFLAFIGLLHYGSLKWFIGISDQKQMNPNMPPLNLMDLVVTQLFGLVNFLMLFIVPILTMRLFSEEKRLGSFELLVTCPLRDWSILLGKFFAALSIGLLALVLVLTYPLVLQWLAGGEMLEWPVIWVSFLGCSLSIMAFISFGLFASSVTENQMLAAVLTLIGLFGFWLIGRMGLGENLEYFKIKVSEVLEHITIIPHMENFTRGQVSLTDVVYFVLFTAFFLILTSKILEARRWRV